MHGKIIFKALYTKWQKRVIPEKRERNEASATIAPACFWQGGSQVKPLTLWVGWLSWVSREIKAARACRPPWLAYTGQSFGEERAALSKHPKDQQTVLLAYSQSLYACKETIPNKAKNQPKALKGTLPDTYTGPGIMSFSPVRIHISWGIRESTQEGLASYIYIFIAHVELLEMKSSMVYKMKNTLDEIDSRSDIIEEKISDHGTLAIETSK